MEKKRLFVGIFIDSKSLNKDYTKLKRDFGGILPGKWVKPENFHITLKFLGYVESSKIDDIKTSLRKILNTNYKETITLNGLGVFPNIDNPKVLYIDVKKVNILYDLNSVVEEKLSFLGFEKEKKPFKPHITIKRIKSKIDKEKFLTKFAKYKNYPFGNIKSFEVSLIESITLPSGAIYRKI